MALALELGLFRVSGIDGLNPKGTVTRKEAVGYSQMAGIRGVNRFERQP